MITCTYQFQRRILANSLLLNFFSWPNYTLVFVPENTKWSLYVRDAGYFLTSTRKLTAKLILHSYLFDVFVWNREKNKAWLQVKYQPKCISSTNKNTHHISLQLQQRQLVYERFYVHIQRFLHSCVKPIGQLGSWPKWRTMSAWVDLNAKASTYIVVQNLDYQTLLNKHKSSGATANFSTTKIKKQRLYCQNRSNW